MENVKSDELCPEISWTYGDKACPTCFPKMEFRI